MSFVVASDCVSVCVHNSGKFVLLSTCSCGKGDKPGAASGAWGLVIKSKLSRLATGELECSVATSCDA